MKEKIERYLIEECGVKSDVVRELLRDKVMKHDDIAKEFEEWLETRVYGGGVKEQGYTAKMIHEMVPRLEGIGVYNFLVTLRDNPSEAQEIIDRGFAVK